MKKASLYLHYKNRQNMLLTFHFTKYLTVCEKQQFSTKALAAKGLNSDQMSIMMMLSLPGVKIDTAGGFD